MISCIKVNDKLLKKKKKCNEFDLATISILINLLW